ncbi:MAG: hypothetical protein LBF71_01360 [Campylobacteraceae bacterium]|nr:hypothetical protein [Campylobacteraceae bacterium]
MYRPIGYSHIFVLLLTLWNSLLKKQLQTLLTLYPRKIKNISATQMRGFKDCYFMDCFVASLLAMTEKVWIAGQARNDGKGVDRHAASGSQ